MAPCASDERMRRLRPVIAGMAAVLAVGATAILASNATNAHAAALIDATATPTLDPLLVPTSAVSAGGLASSGAISTSSSGIQLAVTLSCVTAIAGLIIAVITLTILIRGGYGPFLRALLPARLRGKSSAKAQPTLRYRPGPDDEGAGFDLYSDPRASSRGGRGVGGRSGRDDRSSRPSQSGRGSSRGSSTRNRSRY